jgi:hypothetical protein
MSYKGITRGLFLLALVFSLASCGGGGGSSGGSGTDPSLSGSGFGFFNTFGQTHGAPSPDDFPKLWGVNLPIILTFNEDIDPLSCSNLSINLVTIDDPLGFADYGAGHSATVDYHVFGSELWIKPRMFFSQTEVTFGFLSNALYEISFQLPPSSHVVQSVTGRKISISPTGKPLAFRTPGEGDPDGYIYDEVPGPPEPIGFALFDKQQIEIAHWIDGSWYQGGQIVTHVELDPMDPPDIRIDFNELLYPPLVVNFVDKSSPSLSVSYDFQGNAWDPVRALGEWTLYQSVTGPLTTETYVDFSFDLFALAPDTEYYIEVKGIVEDLAGNSKGYGISDVVSFFTTDNTQPLPPLVEEFDSLAYEDTSATSANWSWDIGGGENALIPGSGGGTGGDGVFFPPDDIPYDAVVDPYKRTVTLPTDKNNNDQRIFNFTSFTLPAGWTLFPIDQNGNNHPLIIKATGMMKVQGTISIAEKDDNQNGSDGVYGDFKIGTDGGTGIAGGGSGGKGGSLYNGMTSPFADVAGYENSYDNFGITGVNTAIQDFALQDSEKLQSEFQQIKDFLDQGARLFLQPNVGMGPGNDIVVTNHPTFVVESVNVNNRVLKIVSDPQHPDYRGSMLQASTNPGIPVPSIAKVNDPYVLGALDGRPGKDPADLGREGEGSEPLTVAQTLTTLASAGGGGGGGGLEAGSVGDTGPDFGPAGFAIGGFSSPYSLGAFGGSECGPSGIVIGPSSSDPRFVLEVESILGTVDYTGYRLNPSRNEGGWIFPIVGNDHNSITIDSVSSGIEVYDLSSLTFDGDEIFQILPPEDVGGAGGGGSGVELTGTIKNIFSPPFQLPGWICGTGGGAGGGVLKMETARGISVSSTGRIYAEGGNGGTIEAPGGLSIPGGGGGSGGSLLLRAKDEIKMSVNSIVSVLGGSGGGNNTIGGEGGAGMIRLENTTNNMKPANFALTTFPAVTEFNLGLFPAQEGNSLALSKFYFMGVSKPDFIYDPNNPDPDMRGLKIVYDMLEIDHQQIETLYEDLIYPDPTGPFPDPIMFIAKFNSCPADFDGFLDLTEVNDDFVEYSEFDTMDGDPYFRFRLLLTSVREVQVGSDTYTYRNLKIKSISFNRSQL